MRLGAIAAMASVAVWLASSSSGCKRSHDGGETVAPAPSASTGFDPHRVLARVGDHAITLGDYAAAIEHMDEFDRLRYEAPERRKHLLDDMIDVLLLADEAHDRGYDRDPEAEEDVREILRDAVLTKARAGAPAPTAIPDEDVRRYYEAHRDEFHDPERRRVSAIVLPTKEAAESVLALAKTADGAVWGQLVRTRSVDPKAKADVPVDLAGDLGFVSPPGDPRGDSARVPQEVRAAVFDVPHVGDVVPHVVAAGGAYYVVKLQSKSDAQDRTLQDAERTIRVKLAHDAARAREDALLDTLRKAIPVEIDEAALARVRVDGGAASGVTR